MGDRDQLRPARGPIASSTLRSSRPVSVDDHFSTTPSPLAQKCQGTMLAWCSITLARSRRRAFSRGPTYRTRLMPLVEPVVKTISTLPSSQGTRDDARRVASYFSVGEFER